MEAQQTAPASNPRRGELAARLDLFTEDDLTLLTDASPATIESWRKRGIGPAYVRCGRAYLYPRAALIQWLERQVREPKAAQPPEVHL